jgi:hypothetical protein
MLKERNARNMYPVIHKFYALFITMKKMLFELAVLAPHSIFDTDALCSVKVRILLGNSKI